MNTSQKPSIGILGYGLASRLAANALVEAGHKVSIFEAEANADSCRSNTSYSSAGMLAPFSERELAEQLVFRMGMAGLELWSKILSGLPGQPELTRNGSLIVVHSRDRSLWQEYYSRVTEGLEDHWLKGIEITKSKAIEPDLAEQFPEAIFFPQEAHMDPGL